MGTPIIRMGVPPPMMGLLIRVPSCVMGVPPPMMGLLRRVPPPMMGLRYSNANSHHTYGSSTTYDGTTHTSSILCDGSSTTYDGTTRASSTTYDGTMVL